MPNGSAKVPKSVAAARVKLEQQGLQVTGQNLKASLSKPEWDALTSAFRSACSASQRDVMKPLSDTEKAARVSQFVLDPVDFKATAHNTVEVFNTKQEKTLGAWLTQAQIGGPSYLNSPEQAKVLCESGDLGSNRPNPHNSLAKFPVWFLTWELLEQLTGNFFYLYNF